MQYRRCGESGILLPAISLGLWHNFGEMDDFETSRKIIHKSFDLGITHFDLANNYGPPAGSAETNFGKILHEDLQSYRDQLIISTKAGYHMWEGPYGEWGSRKHLTSSLDQSLKRLKIDYVDIFYHHRPDPSTPIEESMMALNSMVQQGKALYVGISNYHPKEAESAIQWLKKMGTPCLIHQARYSMMDRWVEEENLLDLLHNYGVGAIAFSPLEQGLLTNKYLAGIPKDSRAGKEHGFLRPAHVTDEKLEKIDKLNQLAANRSQNLAQMAIAWILKDPKMTSVLIGASKVEQVVDSVGALNNSEFKPEELNQIETILNS